tara:strand:- start:7627 stop:7827 length:201 start_codon:yes stop_codon:yes gene_type:complete
MGSLSSPLVVPYQSTRGIAAGRREAQAMLYLLQHSFMVTRALTDSEWRQRLSKYVMPSIGTFNDLF